MSAPRARWRECVDLPEAPTGRPAGGTGSLFRGLPSSLQGPWLDGMSQVYLAAQLQQFAEGARRNDTLGTMRNIAR